MGDVRSRLDADGDTPCIAVIDDDVVMGIVYRDALEARAATRIEEVMQFGVTTVRPSEDLDGLTERMQRTGVDAIMVTNSDARLLGLLLHADVERALEHRPRRRSGGP